MEATTIPHPMSTKLHANSNFRIAQPAALFAPAKPTQDLQTWPALRSEIKYRWEDVLRISKISQVILKKKNQIKSRKTFYKEKKKGKGRKQETERGAEEVEGR